MVNIDKQLNKMGTKYKLKEQERKKEKSLYRITLCKEEPS